MPTPKKKPLRGERRHVPKPSDDAVIHGGITGGFKGYIKSEFTDRLYKPKEGQNQIRLLAWADGRYFGLQIRTHSNVGPGNASYLCMEGQIRDGVTLYDDLEDLAAKDSGVQRKCCICQDIWKQLREGATKQDIKEQRLWPMPRTLYFLVDRQEEEKGVQIWAAPYFKIDEEIRKRVVDPKTGRPLPITDPDDGFDIYFDMEIEKTSAGDFPKYTGLQIAREPSELDVAFYDEVFDLREVLILPKYDEMASDYFGDAAEVVDSGEGDYDDTHDAPFDSDGPEEGQQEESSEEEDDFPCFGDPKEYGEYEDCESTCPRREECREAVERKKVPKKTTRPVRKKK